MTEVYTRSSASFEAKMKTLEMVKELINKDVDNNTLKRCLIKSLEDIKEDIKLLGQIHLATDSEDANYYHINKAVDYAGNIEEFIDSDWKRGFDFHD